MHAPRAPTDERHTFKIMALALEDSFKSAEWLVKIQGLLLKLESLKPIKVNLFDVKSLNATDWGENEFEECVNAMRSLFTQYPASFRQVRASILLSLIHSISNKIEIDVPSVRRNRFSPRNGIYPYYFPVFLVIAVIAIPVDFVALAVNLAINMGENLKVTFNVISGVVAAVGYSQDATYLQISQAISIFNAAINALNSLKQDIKMLDPLEETWKVLGDLDANDYAKIKFLPRNRHFKSESEVADYVEDAKSQRLMYERFLLFLWVVRDIGMTPLSQNESFTEMLESQIRVNICNIAEAKNIVDKTPIRSPIAGEVVEARNISGWVQYFESTEGVQWFTNLYA